MQRYHPLNELAPRDAVSRAIAMETLRTGSEHVFLDLRHLGADHLKTRFPRIYSTCLRYGVDITKDLVPVHPAAHYAMGGVRTDLEGSTSLARLYAAGEAACTGVHGANRLASNSLLEGVVFGARAGRAMRGERGRGSVEASPAASFPAIAENELRALAWQKCGVLRSGSELAEALEILRRVPCRGADPYEVGSHEVRNMHTLAQLIAACALERRESRGGHYRVDCPEKDPAFEKHSIVQRAGEVRFV